MIQNHYLQNIIQKLRKFTKNKPVKVFIFGSSLEKKHFGDVDVGILGDIKKNELQNLQEFFDGSTLPYNVDIVDFNTVSRTFKDNILQNKILWIKR